jgi:hypothetical protein
MDGFYPYPFLNVPELGYMKVMMYVAGISATLIIVGSIFIALSRRVRIAN